MKKSGAYGAIFGGQSYTDNMSRTVVYPSYGIGDPLGGATIIVSYAWTNDALALSSLMGTDSQAALKQRVLQDLAEVHNFNSRAARELEEEWEAVHAFSWSNNPMTMGKFPFVHILCAELSSLQVPSHSSDLETLRSFIPH